jgi:hypothetical protein
MVLCLAPGAYPFPASVGRGSRGPLGPLSTAIGSGVNVRGHGSILAGPCCLPFGKHTAALEFLLVVGLPSSFVDQQDKAARQDGNPRF